MLGAEVESVYAEIGAFFGDSDLDDGAILTLDFANGVFATIDPSWSRGAGFPTWGDVTFRITGTEGVLLVDAFAQHMTAYDHETSETSWLPTGDDMNLLMLRDFVLGIRDDSPAGAGGLDGLRAVEVALAAYRSGSRHEPERVERIEA